ncbi:MAG TPA: secondary thiamine-phosphate synthase enzyme YjbQ [Candidatus Limnocylindria bacterium]|nr:secondary thiamine-phosphate synthase enzyme YjbQ [Candidatus Limnocylindria bacterium]
MTVHHEKLAIATEKKETTVDVTPRVRAAVTRSKVREGICVVSAAHTTAGLFVNENADNDVRRDLLHRLSKIIPNDDDYRHAEGNSPAHIKATLVGNAVTLSVHEGELALGTWQGIYFAEFDGPRERSATVTVIGD